MMAFQQPSRGLVRCAGFSGGLLRAGLKSVILIASSTVALQLQEKHLASRAFNVNTFVS